MTTALITFAIALAWAATTWLAYRIGVGVGLTMAALEMAKHIAASMNEMAATMAPERRGNFEDRVDVN